MRTTQSTSGIWKRFRPSSDMRSAVRRAPWSSKPAASTTAFGAFPLHYDDVEILCSTSLLSYIQTLTLRSDQLPCGVAGLLAQNYGYVGSSCGGVAGYGLGLTPATLYGLPGISAEFSGYHLDGRVQITSGSPSNPLSLSHAPDYAQWSAGGG